MNLSYLAGVWYIVLSNFPMWTKGDKIKPNFNYNIETKNGIRGLSDEVKFLKNGKTKSIKGWDRPTDQENTKFIWRGSGLLSNAKSQWEILYRSEDFSWMVIHFEKTLFTPEGYDVVCKDPKDFLRNKDQIFKKLTELKITGLQEIPQ